MTLLYILIILVMIMFKQQAKSLLESVIKLIVAISEALTKSIK